MADKTKAQLEEELKAATERADKAEQDLEDATKVNAELRKKYDELQAHFEASDTVDPKEFAANQEALRLQEEAAAEADERIADLELQVANLSEKTADAKVTDLPRVDVDGKVYQIRVPSAFLNGRKYTAEEISEDEDLCLELVEKRSSILRAL